MIKLKRMNEMVLDPGEGAIIRDRAGWELHRFKNTDQDPRSIRDLACSGDLWSDAEIWQYLEMRCSVEAVPDVPGFYNIYMTWEV